MTDRIGPSRIMRSVGRGGALFLAVALLLALAATTVSAGWVLEEVDTDFPDETTYYYIQGGKVKVVGALEDLTLIVDVTDRQGYLVDTVLKQYAGGSIDGILAALKRLDEEEGYEPPPPGDAGVVAPKVVTRELPATEKVAGFDVKRFQVEADGEVVEELWFAPAVDTEKDVDYLAFVSLMDLMLGGEETPPGEASPDYEDTDEYRALYRAGFPLRQDYFFLGEKSTVEIRSAAKQDLPEDTFTVPPGLEEADYLDLLIGEE